MPAKGVLIGVGAVVCAAVPPAIEKLFSQQQTANSLLPLLIALGVPFFVSLIVSSVQPNATKMTAAWIALAAGAYVAGDVYAIFYVRRGESNLWPVEIVMSAALAAGALIGGAVLGRARSKGAPGG